MQVIFVCFILPEKELIINAFCLIINSYKEKNGKIFKFSDKNSNENKDIEILKSNKCSTIKNNNTKKNDENQEIIDKNSEILINEAIIKNKIKDVDFSEDDTERKIEKILKDNKKI